ncbi:MAG: hypothetical protein U0797_18215 [Gemmataceae bacterium]
MSSHLRVNRYGDFVLTDAVRPAPHLPVVPREAYRGGAYRDKASGARLAVLAASVSRERLFDVFLELLDPLGEAVDVVLETSHDGDGAAHRDLLREGIDLPVLASHLCEFEDLLLNDGCAGVAVLSTAGEMEVQFDEHKLLVVYAREVGPFEAIFRRAGVRRDDRLRLITEGEHLHSTLPRYRDEFEQLCCRVGVAPQGEVVRW